MNPSDEHIDSSESTASENDQCSPGDDAPASPTIRTFLRHAAAIIAAERGLTEDGRKKLQALAIRLGMNDHQRREALERLQQGSAELGDSLSHWEQAFVSLLRKQFAAVKHGILSVSMENRAIELAKTKFQIHEIRAQQLINRVVEDLGMGRIEQTDAQQFGVRLITDLVGRQTELDDEFRQRLVREGKKWGLDRDAIDRVVADAVRETRRREQAVRPISKRLVVALIVVAMTAVGGLGYYVVNASSGKSGPNAGHPQPADPPGTEEPALDGTSPASPMPVWWTAESVKAYRALAQQEPGLAERLRELAHAPESERRGVADQLEIAFQGGATSRPLSVFLALWYLNEPSEVVAQSMLERLKQQLDGALSTRPTTRETIRKCWAVHDWIHRTVVAETQTSIAPGESQELHLRRSSAVRSLVAEVYGDENLAEERQRLNQVAVARFWLVALEDALERPLASAYLVGILMTESKGVIPEQEIQAWADEIVGIILEKQPSQWRILQPVIELLIQNANPAQRVRWLRRRDAMTDPTAVEFLTRCLKLADGQDVGNETAATGMNSADSNDQPGAATMESIWLEHHRTADNLMVRIRNLVPTADGLTPQQIAYLVHGVQVNLQLIAQYAPSGATGSPVAISTTLPLLTNYRLGAEGQRRERTPSPAQLRELQRMVDRLSRSRSDQLASRETALKRLAELESHVDDLSVDQANQLASWILGRHPESEALVIEQILPQLAHWPRLVLAISDRLDDVELPLDDALTLFNRLTDQTFELSQNREWKSEMRRALVNHAAVIVHRRAVRPVAVEQQDWLRLEKYIAQMETPRERWVAVIAGTPARTPATNQPAGRYPAIASQRARWRFMLESAQQIDSMQRWALESRVLAEWVAAEIRSVADPSDDRLDRAIARYRVRVADCATSAELLGQTEFFLMEVVDLWRRLLLEKLTRSREARLP